MEQRTIKFRAWDKKYNVMWQGIELVKLLKYLVFQEMPNAEAYTAFKTHPDDFVWLQNTGIKDKNGREIFEGDVLSDTHYGTKGQIIWKNEFARFVVQELNPEKEFELWSDNEMLYHTAVIGNIYENPELLNPPPAE